MRKTLFIFTTILAFLVQENIYYAQELNGVPIGPIPKMSLARNHSSTNPVLNPASIAYGYSSNQEFTLSMPIPNATPFTLLAPYTFSGFASSMCKGGDGKYYVTECDYNQPPILGPFLYEFNPVTGSITPIGSIIGLGNEYPSGIAYNPADGSYYICTHDALFSFELTTRVATFIGSFGLTDGYMDDLCFDATGVCYAIAIGSAKGYIIDITTGFPTLLGSLGYYAIYGHGMSYDFETSTIYISAYNHTPQTGQLRIMDPVTGSTVLVTDWGFEQIAPFALDSYYGQPCPVSSPFNPYPANGAIDVSINDFVLSWSNGTGTSNIEVWFGLAGNLVKVYDGVEISSWAIDTLSYSTTYNWRIICKNDLCQTAGPYWSFQTKSDSSMIFYEPFNNLSCWTPIGPQGTTYWYKSNTNNAGGSPSSELKFVGWYPGFLGLSQLLSCPIYDDSYHYIVKLKHKIDLYSGGTNDEFVGLAVTYDGGLTKQLIWQCALSGNIGPEEIETEFYPSSSSFQMILQFEGFSIRLDYWYVDDLQLIDDCMECFPPATPSNLLSFHYFNPRRVLIYWQDNSWNEEGFKVFRKNGFPNDSTQYQLIGTSPADSRNYWDYNIFVDSVYTYSVLAFNQYGESDTSITTTIIIPPIPVELISFTASINKGDVILNWSTATELNNLGFEIERKTIDEYYTIGFVEGNGSTTEIQNYLYTDAYAERGINYYRLKQIDFNGSSSYSDEIEVDNNIPNIYSLEQNYPNPFNPRTTIKYEVPEKTFVTIKVFDALGDEVATLVNDGKPSGSYEVAFDGSSIPSGIYFYKLQTGSFVETKKMILLK